MKDISIFLGANTARGFRSLYEEYIGSLDLRRLYVIKGSAGCGKSGLMKRASERAAGMGLGCVRVLCSGDPDSLDGVLIPERGIAFFDGTSPHVLEPALTGQQGFYLDLSRFYTSPAKGLETPDAAYREHYRRAYRYLAAAGSLEEIPRCSEATRAAVSRRAEALAARTLGRGRGKGSLRRFYTDAFTCRGFLSLEESRRALVPRLLSLSGSRARTDVFLQVFLRAALERSREVILCPDPTEDRRTAHLLLPELGLGITTGPGDRRIHLEKLGPPLSREETAQLRELEKLRASLLDRAQAELAMAKRDHDALEAAVRPFIDFAGMTEETDALIRRVLEEA